MTRLIWMELRRRMWRAESGKHRVDEVLERAVGTAEAAPAEDPGMPSHNPRAMAALAKA